MSIIGDRTDTRYIKHANAASTGALSNGQPISSGTVMREVDSNINHLITESCRQLVFSLGPGSVTDFTNAASLWDGIRGVSAPTSTSFGGTYQEIPWDRRTAVRFGPFPGIADRELSAGVATLRTVKCYVDANIDVGVTSHTAYFALTTSSSAQALFNGGYLAYTSASFGGTGTRRASGTLSTSTPALRLTREAWTCRASAANGNTQSIIIPIYVWFGWRFLNSTDCYINAFSAWESR